MPAFTTTIEHLGLYIRVRTRSNRGSEEGIKVGGRWITARWLADDQPMVAKSQKGLQAMMDKLDTTSRKHIMRINIKETKVLRISKGKETIVRINIGEKEIEQVKEFRYL